MRPPDRWGRVERTLAALALILGFLLPVLTDPARVKAAPAVVSLNPAVGSVADSVALSGAIDTLGGAFRVRWDTTTGAVLTSGTAPAGSNAISATFLVPDATRGAHGVILEDVAAGAFSPAASFAVNPRLVLSGTRDAVGTPIVVTGTGYLSAETGFVVTYDGIAASATVTAGVTGTWNASIVIPQSTAGVHIIDADVPSGSNPLAVNFTVVPVISLSATSGSGGTSLTVTGTGFRLNESGITVTWDSTTSLFTGITANSVGSWGPITTTIPTTTPGSHYINAFGNTTTTAEVTDRVFQAVVPVIIVNPTSGPVGQEVVVNGNDFRASETGIVVTFAGTAVKAGISADSTGAWSASFIVPESAGGGNQKVDAYGSLTSATAVADVPFSVIPRITISPASGATGATVTVTATGFRSGEGGISIIYDGGVVKSGILANSLGSWSSTFTVPPAAAGGRSVDASGNATPATTVPDVTFSQAPTIAISPSSGTAGSSVTVSGSGFFAGESGIAVTWGTGAVRSGIVADSKGSWTATFAVPAVSGGARTVDAYGANTPASAVPDISFAVRPQISISPASGAVGAGVTVAGTSFGAVETGVSVTYEGVVVASGINAGNSGEWSATITVPPSPAGNHKVDAYGSITNAADVADASFAVSPELAQTPASGNVGTSVTLNGTGFAAGKAVSITFDGAAISPGPSPVATGPAGSFTATLTIPRSKAGAHKIAVTDGDRNSREVTWTMESAPPPAPGLVSPGPGARISLFGNVPVSFDWTDVSDPSGVYYAFQVATRADFATAFINEQNLASSAYTTRGKLVRGTFYWRVMAVDGAYNQSAWSGPYTFKVGLMPLWSFLFLVVAGIVLIGGVVTLISRR